MDSILKLKLTVIYLSSYTGLIENSLYATFDALINTQENIDYQKIVENIPVFCVK